MQAVAQGPMWSMASCVGIVCPMDAALLRWLNEQAADHRALGSVVGWSAEHLALVLVATFAAGWMLVAVRRMGTPRRISWDLLMLGLSAVLALAIGLALNQLIGHLWFRPRPYDAIDGLTLLLPRSPDPSFPSDHATGAFALTLVSLALLPRLGWILMIETALLVLGRVASGLHYPSDVLAGFLTALIGAAAALTLVPPLNTLVLRSVAYSLDRVVRIDSHSHPVPHARVGTLRTAGLAGALLGLPALVEAVADPVRLHPEWLELLTLAVGGLALTSAYLLLSRLAARAHLRSGWF